MPCSIIQTAEVPVADNRSHFDQREQERVSYSPYLANLIQKVRCVRHGFANVHFSKPLAAARITINFPLLLPTKIMLHCTREAVLEKINDSGLFDFFGHG
jgi:hypothetical protein